MTPPPFDPAALDALAEALAQRLAAQIPGPRLLDSDQAAARLNVPSTWLRAQAREGKCPSVRLGHYVRFDAEELDAWWRSHARGPRRTEAAA